jgi:hypothetical protein
VDEWRGVVAALLAIYGGFAYATLRDPRTTDTIDARIPVALAAGLDWNREAVFVGLIYCKARRGELRPEFRVDAVQVAGPLRLPSKDEVLQRWSAAIARPKRDVRMAFQGRRFGWRLSQALAP